MRPFDLELWKAGEPVILRNGQKVEQLTKFDLGHKFMLAGVVDDTFLLWEIDGSYFHDSEKSNFDLFHPETEMWVNVYESGTGQKTTSNAFDSYDKAIFNHELLSKQMHQDARYMGTFKLVKE